MTAMLTCPDLGHFRKLVAGDLDAAEQAALTEHLDQCPYCQEQVDRLATGQEFARNLNRERSVAGPALHLAMAELQEESPSTAGDAVTEDDWPLDFLEPSAKPECLGRFARYDVYEVLGRGGFGVVLKAFDEELNRFVAIKVLAPPLAASGAARRRFAREARAAAAVSHEHVVAIHAVDTSGTLPYLVMQYVPGVSLQERLDADGPLGIEEILRIGYQAACGLAAAHKQGLIHRDIKPANILLENCVERVKITDFGLARAIDDASLTQSGVLAGTPQYMAPEQAKGETLDHRTDLFSLGSVLYAMCTGGRPPFRAASTMAVLRRVCDDKPRPIRQINAAIPASLAQIVERLLEKDPARRFQSATEVSEILSQKLTELQQPSDLVGVKWPSTRGRTMRRCLAAAAVLLVAVAGLAAGEQSGVTKVREWAATILRIRTPEGTLVVEVGDPAVKVSVDGDEVTVTGAGLAELKLKPGKHKVEAVKGTAKVHDELVDIQRDGKLVVKVTLEKSPESVAASPPAGSKPNEARPIYLAPADPTHTLHFTTRLSPSAVTSLAFSPDGVRLVAAQQADALYILNAADGKIIYRLNPPAADNTVSAAFSVDGKWLTSASVEGNVSRWDVVSGKLQTVTRLEHPVHAIAFAPDGQTAASGGDSRLTLWEVKTGKSLAALPIKAGSASAIAFSPDGQHLAVTGKDRVVRVWDAATGKQLSSAPSPSEVKALAFSADGKYLAYGREDGKIVWVSPAGGQEVRTWEMAPALVQVLRFSADGKQLASGGDDSAVRVWDVATGKEVFKLQEKPAKVTQIAFSPDGKFLAWGTSDGTIRVMRLRELPPTPSGARNELDHLKLQLAEALERERASRAEAEKQRRVAEDRARAAEAALKSAQTAAERARYSEEMARAEAAVAEANARLAVDFLQKDLLAGTREEKRFTIEMRNLPWAKVFEYLSDVSKLPVTMTSKPAGTFTFVAPPGKKASFTLTELIDLINEGLVTQKLLLVRQEKSFMVISPSDTIGPALIKPVKAADLNQHGKTELVSLVFAAGDFDVKSLENVVKKLLGPFGMCVARANDKTLYVRDTAGNVRRIHDALKAFDEAAKEKAKP
jgi:WD40 repeat protein